MSATGRGAKRRNADFYPTPAATTQAILRAVNLPGGRWLEPSAGEGGIIRAVNAVRSDVEWTAVEMRQECAPFLASVGAVPVIADFLDAPTCFEPARFDVAILNPPFTLALPFMLRALECADWVVALERLHFIAPQNRNRFWREHMPDLYVLPNRPDFTGGGGDLSEYAWLVWPPGGHDRSFGRVEVLPVAPTQMEMVA